MLKEKEKVIDAVSEWIDTYVIANAIVEELEEAGETVTVERCQEVWYRVLENLHHSIREEI